MKYYFLALGTLVVVCVGCAYDNGNQFIRDSSQYTAPPAGRLQRPGPMVDGPGPGVMPMPAAPPTRNFATLTTQVRFIGPAGMRVGWKIPTGYAENQVTAPGRYNYRQGSTYRLKLTDIPGRPGAVLYPTLQVYPSHPTTDAYLSHNSVPVELGNDDLDQVESNNFVTKVIYLPAPKYQGLAISGIETLVSTKLEPGVDPVAEADRRGTIMLVWRMGNMDLEMPDGKSEANVGFPDGINQVSYRHANGDEGQYVPPMPIAGSGRDFMGVPNPMIVGGSSAPGMPAYHPIAGVGGIQSWGMPMTGTPIGIPGPPHLPFGGPAGLKSHTVRNFSRHEGGERVDHFLLDVKHSPGTRMPKPVKHMTYSESHVNPKPGEALYPAWAVPQRVPSQP